MIGNLDSTLCQANWKRNQHKDSTSNFKTVLIVSCVSIMFENGFD